MDHIRHTHDPARNAFSVGQPEHGAELADDLERLVALHDASTIAAVIVEPVAGSTGVLLPPKGYLQRLREICDRHGILLIFDEVITGFGRTGQPFAAQTFGVTPDLMTVAKGLTNGCVPMGAVFAKQDIHDAFMTGPEHLIEFFHGYTYSAHPLACAAGAGHAGHLRRGRPADARRASCEGYFAEAVHSLKGAAQRHRHPQHRPGRRHRAGAAAGRARPSAPSTSSSTAGSKGVLVRTTGDTVALSPPLIIETRADRPDRRHAARRHPARRLSGAARPPTPHRGPA